jgi:hypothetical protein
VAHPSLLRALFAGGAAALAVGAAAGAAGAAKVIGRSDPLQGKRTASATGGTTAPKLLSVRVVAAPAQKVTVTSSVICSKSGSTGTDAAPEHELDTAIKSGKFSARAPLTRPLTLPIAHPESWCSVVVYSTLSKRGKQTVYILAG